MRRKMKHSIKRQMAGIFIGVMTGTFLCCALVNVLFLERYYLANKKKDVLSAYHVLNEGAGRDRLSQESFAEELNLICTTDNISIFVMDSSGEPKLWTPRDYELLQRKLYSYIFEAEARKTVILEKGEHYVLRETRGYLSEGDYLEVVGMLDSGEPFIMQTALESIRESADISIHFFLYIACIAVLLSSLLIWWLSRRISGEPFIMQTALESIRESADISIHFFLYIACIAVLLSSLLIWWLSRRISEPILELTDISKRMTELDFDAKFTSPVQNEIGVLGDHINQLSENLERTISELKTANNELQKDIEKKTQIDEMRKEFLSNVSHELKTPIALIQGYAEGLKECINDDAESRDFYCEVIMDEAGKMNAMVKNLLSLNQLEFGNDVVAMERFDIVALIRNVLNSANILMEQKGIRLIFKETQEIYVWADEFKVEEVVTNYISNAVNHCDYDKVIEVKVIKEEDKVRVTVFNTGNPIPEEELDKVWIKFYKVDKARTREYGGSGIGLSIVKAIMESLHRDCGVRNYRNGVEFWFELDAKVGK